MARKQVADKEASDFIEQRLDLNFNIKSPFHLTPTHQEVLDTALSVHTNMIFIDGCAGSCKTYIATLAALNLLQTRNVDEIVYIRSLVESASRQMGYLPGDADEKFSPWTMPLLEKLDELVHKNVADRLFSSGSITCLPVNFTRGLTFKNKVVIVDESQNLTKKEIVTILTRFGKKCKLIMIGDSKQHDIANSGFGDVYGRFDDQECIDNGIYCYKFTPADVMRSKLLRFIVSRLEA